MSPLSADRPALGRPAAAVLFVGDPDKAIETPHALLVRLYRLTGGEACLAAALAAGERMEDYAARRGVSVETVRSQLRQVFAKTGTHRQSDLIRVILTGPATLVLGGGRV